MRIAMAKALSNTSPEYAAKVALYEKLVATNPAVERKGATMPYTSVNGHMFSVLDKTGTLALRLAPAEREAFVAKYKTKPVEMYGMTMEEYVAVPDALLAKTSELKPFFDASYRYVASLKPKPTTRAKQVKTEKKSSAKKAATPGVTAKSAKDAKSAKAAKAAKSTTSTKRPKRIADVF
jgi:hypothetical protein